MKQRTKKNIALLIVGAIIFIGAIVLWASLELTGSFWKYLLMIIGAGIFSKGWRNLEKQDNNHEL